MGAAPSGRRPVRLRWLSPTAVSSGPRWLATAHGVAGPPLAAYDRFVDLTHELSTTIERALDGTREVLEAYLFGSTARDEADAASDVDVAVFLAPSLTLVERGRLALAIGAALASALGRDDVDLVVLNEAPPLLYYRVLRDGVRVLARELRATAVREGQARLRWYDWQPVQDRADAVRQRRRRARAVGQ